MAYNEIDIEVKARADTSQAEAKVDGLHRKAKALGAEDVTVDVDVDAAKAGADLDKTKRKADELDRADPKVTPHVNAGPALAALKAVAIAAAGVAAGALGGLALGAGAALGGGLVAAVAGMSGIGTAVTAAGKAAGGASGPTRDYAAALHAVRSAQWDLKRAQEDEKDAAAAVHDARVQAKRDLEDLQRQTEDMALSQEQAALNVEQAWADYQYTLADPRATDLQRRQAELAYREALQRQKDLKADAEDLAERKADADKKGVNGSDAVRDAQDRLRDAHHQVAEALYQVAQAQKAMTAGAAAAGGGVNALAQAMKGLGPNAREFVTFMRGFIDGPLARLRQAGQEAFLPGLQAGLVAIEPVMRKLQGPFAEVSRLAGRAAGEFIKIGAQAAGPFLKFAAEAMRDLAPLGPVFADLADALGGVLDEFVKSGDMKKLMGSVVDLVRTLARHLPDLVDAFLDLGVAVGPALIKALDALVPLIVEMAKALGPALVQALTALQPFLDAFGQWVADHPQDFADLTVAVTGVALAIGGIAAVLPAAIALFEALSSPVGLVAAAVVVLAAGAVLAYKKFKPFRDAVDRVGDALKKHFLPRVREARDILHDKLEPALDKVKKAIKDNKPELDKLGRLLKKAGGFASDLAAVCGGEVVKSFASMAGILGAHLLDDLSAFVWFLGKAVDLAGELGDMTGLSSLIGGGSPGHHETGGIIGAATGGARGGLTWVGERGPELVRLPYGSQVSSAGDSRRMAGEGRGHGGGSSVHISVSDSEAGRLLVSLLQKAVKARGGDVLVTLGQRHA